jgi:hypothetical protein
MSASVVPVIYTTLAQYEPARELVEAAAVLLEKAEKYQQIPSEADVEVVSEFRARLNETIGKLDSARLKATEEARNTVAAINAEAGTKLEPMRTVLARTDKLLKDYRAAQEAKRLAAIAAQEAEARRLALEKTEAERKEREAREAAAKATDAAERARLTEEARDAAAQLETATLLQEVVTQAVVPTPAPKSIRGSHGSSTSFRDHWVWRLTDITKVPDAYMLPPEDRLDRKVLNAAAQSKKDKDTIPGIEIYNDPVPASRSGR